VPSTRWIVHVYLRNQEEFVGNPTPDLAAAEARAKSLTGPEKWVALDDDVLIRADDIVAIWVEEKASDA
jgi:hypothetical protein